MKKKSPPYAIIGAVLLGLVLVFALVQYSKKVEADKKAIADAAEQKRIHDLEEQAKAAGAKPVITQTSAESRAVLYATQPVQPGVLISPAFYEKKMTPNDILPDAFTEASDITGWVAIRAIEKGDPLTPRNIGKSLPYLTQRIPPGMRALALPVFLQSDINKTGGFVVDGDQVDLLFTTYTEDKKYSVNTQTVLQNVKVLFVPGPQVKTEQSDGLAPIQQAGPISIVFEVTPEAAQALVYLSSLADGRFSMILRSRKDKGITKIKAFDIRDYDFYKLNKLQKTVDKSQERVSELADEIAKEEKAAQGSTNETKTPTPPTP